ncbi:MAG TPA: EamA family transporter [Gemmatimonadaceae bacterium]|nr:EamA family transporter [Gemmatimonadaceae bacterium]
MTEPRSQAPSRARLAAAFFAVYVVWGSTYLFIKIVVADIPPFLAAALRHTIAGVLLYAWARARGAPRPSAPEWLSALAAGVLLLTTGNGMVNWASQRVPSGLSALVVSSVPIWIVLVDWVRPGGARPGRRTMAGVALGSMGVAGLVWSAGGVHQGARQPVAIGCLGLLFGSLSWAVGTILSRQLRRHPDGALASAMQMVTGGIALGVLGSAAGELARFHPSAVPVSSWLALAYLVFAGSIIGFTSYTWLLRVSTPAKVATYAYVNPVVAVLLGWAFVGERLSGATLIAAAVILVAVAVATVPAPSALRQVSGGR